MLKTLHYTSNHVLALKCIVQYNVCFISSSFNQAFTNNSGSSQGFLEEPKENNKILFRCNALHTTRFNISSSGIHVNDWDDETHNSHCIKTIDLLETYRCVSSLSHAGGRVGGSHKVRCIQRVLESPLWSSIFELDGHNN